MAKADLPPEFIPHSLRHCFASAALARVIPITEVSRWLGHRRNTQVYEGTNQIQRVLTARQLLKQLHPPSGGATLSVRVSQGRTQRTLSCLFAAFPACRSPPCYPSGDHS